MAEVFAARDIHTDTKVAVKILSAGHLSPGILKESFEREVRSLGELRHPSIVRLLDHGFDERSGFHFIVLEWVESDLSTLIHSHPIDSWDQFFAAIFRPLLDGLSEAHSRGISHRDVKPSNILVDSAGSPLLTDFGISKLKSYLFPSLTLNQFMSVPYAPAELDDGSYTATRDVYGIVAVAVGCLARTTLADHAELMSALDRVPVPIVIHSILKQALSRDPAKRHQNAAVLLAALDAAQEQRGISQTPRTDIYVDLSSTALTQLLEVYSGKSRDEATALLLTDLNLICGVGMSTKDATALGDPVLYGGQFICHCSFALPLKDHLVVRRLSRVSPSVTEKARERALEMHLRFRPGKPTRDSSAIQGMIGFQEQLQAFQFQLAAKDVRSQESELLQSWTSILNAKTSLEKAKEKPLRYKSYRSDGNKIIFEIEGVASEDLLDQQRIVKDNGMMLVSGSVQAVSDCQISLQISKSYARELPRSGLLSVDIEAARLAIDRQRAALDAVRYRRAIRSDLGDLLVFPDRCSIPDLDVPMSPFQKQIDEPKLAAVAAALGTKDFLVVEGPPGTGKTTFISELILQLVSKDPTQRILLTSQTHVALDNALENLLAFSEDYRIVRVGRSGNPKISSTVNELLLENQMDRWREQVLAKGLEFLNRFATEHGISSDQVRLGMSFERLSQVQREITEIESRITTIQAELKSLPGQATNSSSPEEDEILINPLLDKHRLLEEELAKLRTESRLKAAERNDTRTEITNLEPDAAELLELPTDDLSRWAELYLPGDSKHTKLKAVFATHAEWQARFGRTPDFAPALLRSAQIVAGTCVGIASVKGLQDLDFDTCIVDEASKATPTEMLVPLSRSRKWIVVGDHRQLPPFLDEGFREHAVLQEFGLDEQSVRRTIFDRLRESLPANCQKLLSIQYRMVPGIGDLISSCFYDGKLKSAAKKRDEVLFKIFPKPVVWLSTSRSLQRFEKPLGNSFWNEHELGIVHRYLIKINAAAAKAGKIYSVAVMTGYGSQRSALERRFRNSVAACQNLELEWNTVDSVQGREADIAIYSVVRSNKAGKLGFLKELSRLNVALSRGRQVLLLIGDDVFLRSASGENPFKRVIEYIEQHPSDCALAEENS
jgi:superfamily I DNA and/or RNA helicase